MEVCRRSSWLLLLLGVSLLANILQGVQGEVESEGPSESECRPYIEKALKELETGESDTTLTPETEDSKEDLSTVEVTTDDSDRQEGDGDNDTHEEGTESIEDDQNLEDEQVQEGTQEEASEEETGKSSEGNVDTQEEIEDNEEAVTSGEEKEEDTEEQQEKVESEEGGDAKSQEGEDAKSQDGGETEETTEDEDTQERVERETAETDQTEDTKEENDSREESHDTNEADDEDEIVPDKETESVEDHVTAEEIGQETQEESEESKQEEKDDTQEDEDGDQENQSGEKEGGDNEQDDKASDQESENSKQESTENVEEGQQTSQEEDQENTGEQIDEDTREDETKEDEHDGGSEGEQDTKSEDDKSETKEDEKDETNEEQEAGSPEAETAGETDERSAEKDDDSTDKTVSEGSEEGKAQTESTEALEENADVKNTGDENSQEGESREQTDAVGKTTEEDDDSGEDAGEETAPVEELSLDVEIPSELRDRNHVEHLLKLDEEASETEKIINRVAEITLRELKKLYENAIKPLEVLYKYRDLSNRHFGDAEIFSKPLILFMGPWSGGKSSIINYLLDNEYNETSLRTGAEPSPAYFNILMYGDEPEIWDGTQLAADFTFSGLQKFGQGLEERLRGVRLPNKLLEKVNIVEIPGILEVRKQVSRVFPFNDACQWFIDRADIIFLVYDPSKLDVGPETEAILDQLKGREHQTRIILNKADQVKPEELMRVQGALIWNISPLMSSPQPPVMYTTSLWSRPYEPWAPVRLLHAQERAFLRDLRSAIDKRIENKIASARRFAVRVRNHAKMVDCYLTTYYNHKSVFGNRKQVADEIIEHPQDYHIYEGLSTLTNISRYDLPDPDVYRDFFKLNPLYDFQQLSATCTYFRGCPINRLDVAIAYDLPELVGKHKRLVESALAEANQTPVPSS